MAASVKICGFRTPDTLVQLGKLGLPADYIGLVFAESKRRVTIEEAALLTGALRQFGHSAGIVGVFVDSPQHEVAAAVRDAGLTAVQLHGSEAPSYVEALRRELPGNELIKSIGIAAGYADQEDRGAAAAREQLQAYAGLVDVILLDTHDPIQHGGTGRTFAWELIPHYRQACLELGMRLWVAGGLSAGNVAELLARYEPDGVDISSGVETNGVKDIAKIREFVERVKEA